MTTRTTYPRTPEGDRARLTALDEALAEAPTPELEAFMATHTDEALHGPEVAAERAKARRKLPRRSRSVPRLSALAAEREMRANWAAFGVGPYPGTPAEQERRHEERAA